MTETHAPFRCLACGEALPQPSTDGICPNCGARGVVDLTAADGVEVLRASLAPRPWTHNLASELKVGLGIVALIVVGVAIVAALKSRPPTDWAEVGPRLLVTPRAEEAAYGKWLDFTRAYKTQVIDAARNLAPCFENAGFAAPTLRDPPYWFTSAWRLDAAGEVGDVRLGGTDVPAGAGDCVVAAIADWAARDTKIPGEAEITVELRVYQDHGRINVVAPRWFQVAR